MVDVSVASTSSTALALVQEVGILVGIVPHGDKVSATELYIVLYLEVTPSLFLSLSLFHVFVGPNRSCPHRSKGRAD